MSEKEFNDETSFEELLKASDEAPGRKFFPGEKVSGKVFQITKDTVFIDLGGKSEGIAEIQEFRDKEGELSIKPGDDVEMRVASVRDGIHLTKGLRIQGAESLDLLREAKENLIPVEGKVAGVNKGGFEIDLSGIRAFCPLGQIDIQFCEKPEDHMGKRYSFRITEFKENGKNIVVSRRQLLKEEQEKKWGETLATLKPGLECEGIITKLTDFGAFADIGGMEGLIHISEISHGRIKHPSEILKPGQPIRVKVLKVEPDKENRPKISLSIKSLEPDSWDKGLDIKEGEILHGKISRITDFGAFVEVAPGVDGLVHVSEISYERVAHPNQILKEGEEVEVLVMGIDPETRRVSLSMKEVSVKKRISSEAGSEKIRLEVGQVLRGMVEDSKPFGLFIRLPQFGPRVRGLLPMEELKAFGKVEIKKKFPRGQEIQVEISAIDSNGKIRLSQRTIEEKEDQKNYERFMESENREGNLGTLGDLFKDLKLK